MTNTPRDVAAEAEQPAPRITMANHTDAINFELRRLKPHGSYYDTRAHVPMIQGSVCVGFSVYYPQEEVKWDQTAHLYIARNDDSLDIAVTDLRRDSDGRRVNTGLVHCLLSGAISQAVPQDSLEGFVINLNPSQPAELTGLRGGAEVALPEVDRDVVGSFSVACLVILRKRADALS